MKKNILAIITLTISSFACAVNPSLPASNAANPPLTPQQQAQAASRTQQTDIQTEDKAQKHINDYLLIESAKAAQNKAQKDEAATEAMAR